MSSHVKGTLCCARHKRLAPKSVVKKRNVAKLALKPPVKALSRDKRPVVLAYTQKPNGIWSLKFRRFTKMRRLPGL